MYEERKRVRRDETHGRFKGFPIPIMKGKIVFLEDTGMDGAVLDNANIILFDIWHPATIP